jgi:hypothetical protein
VSAAGKVKPRAGRLAVDILFGPAPFFRHHESAFSTVSVHNLVEKSPSCGLNSLIQLCSWHIAQNSGVFFEEGWAVTDAAARIPAAEDRLLSVDFFRGFTMFLRRKIFIRI